MTNPWSPQLLETATFYTISLSIVGSQEKKTETLLYSEIPCNLVERAKSFGISADEGQSERHDRQWRCDVEGQYDGGEIGDRVKIEGVNYEILQKVEDTDFYGNRLFVKYDIKKME